MINNNSNRLMFLGGFGKYRITNISKKQLSREYHTGNRVYDSNGIAQTLTAQSMGGMGGYSGLYLIRMV